MKITKLFNLIQLLLMLTFSISCTSNRNIAKSRIALKMPTLIDVKKFKNELPLTGLNSLRKNAKKQGFLTPGLNYFFIIDTNGHVVHDKLSTQDAFRYKFFETYIKEKFIMYQWYPAFYSNTKEKLTTSVGLSIYEIPGTHIFSITIKLFGLINKEKLDDVQDERNLIYKFKIRSE